jgi:hypothetical protein
MHTCMIITSRQSLPAEGGFTSIYVGPGAPGDIHAGFDEGKVFHTVFLSVTGSVS